MRTNLLRRLAVLPIVFYQKLVSPLTPGTCIYHPTCSHYALEAIGRHGVIRGSAAALLRLLRCWGMLYSGGEDPVPNELSWRFLLGRYRLFWRWRRAGR